METGGQVIFSGAGNGTLQLWVTNGTLAGTHPLYDI